MRKRRGQSTVEYAVLAAVVVGALLVMQVYMKRGISGKFRESTDRIGEQYTPYTSTYNLNTGSTSDRTETTTAAGTSISAINKAETQTREGGETTAGKVMSTTAASELWDKQ